MGKKEISAGNPHLKKLQSFVGKAPTDPGIYKWLNGKGDVLYVGKAKNLRNRLKSYVLPSNEASLGPWKQSLVGIIADVDITVTNSELEALILETNLIKTLRPKYNVMMKDDKNYVYVRISTQNPFPSVTVVRQIEEDKAKYFGPFLSSYEVRRTLDALHEVFPYKTSTQTLRTLNGKVKAGKSLDEAIYPTPPLAVQIGKECPLGTPGYTRENYLEAIHHVMRFFQGDFKPSLEEITAQMKQAAIDRKFERAARLRDALTFIESLQREQIVADTSGLNADYFGVALQAEKTQVVVLRERNGRLIGEFSFNLRGSAESAGAVLEQFLPQYYSTTEDIPDLIAVSESIEEPDVLGAWLSERKDKRVDVALPERGKKSKLLLMAERNAQAKVQQQLAKWEAAAENREKALEALHQLLKLAEPPKRIEGYDISHLGGTETVGSMVVMKDGQSANDHYRSFTIRSMKEGDIDDYKALKEVLKRRLYHLVRNVKVEEQQWKKEEITFGKARKKEREALKDKCENLTEHALVARKGEDVVVCAWICEFKGGILEFKILSFENSSDALEKFTTRKLLHSVKKGKIYTVIPAEKEAWWSDIGFRHVNTVPEVFLGKPGIVMVYMVSEHKEDVSLSSRPSLLVIDGGKGQLGVAVEVLKELKLEIPVIGLAKREEDVFIPGDKAPVLFPAESQGKFLLMRLRDEAHRFANRHRETRGAHKAVHSALDEVPGIGEKTKTDLLKAFGSVTAIKQASDTDLKPFLTAPQLEALRQHL